MEPRDHEAGHIQGGALGRHAPWPDRRGLGRHYATGMHDYVHPCNDWDKCYWLNWLFPVQVKSLDPDETIGTSFSDYRARRDPVLERAVARAGGS
jgi:hypothetical protein